MDLRNHNQQYNDYYAINVPVSLPQEYWNSGSLSITTKLTDENMVTTEEESKTLKNGYYLFLGSSSNKIIAPLEMSFGGTITIAIPSYAKFGKANPLKGGSLFISAIETNFEETNNKLGKKIGDKLVALQEKIGSDLFSQLTFDQKILMADTFGAVSLPSYVTSEEISTDIAG